jgi:pilus assembly protein Flp/PilA
MRRPLSRPSRPRRLLGDRRGASTVEYGLILAFIVLMMFGALMNVAGITKDMWNDMAAKVASAK